MVRTRTSMVCCGTLYGTGTVPYEYPWLWWCPIQGMLSTVLVRVGYLASVSPPCCCWRSTWSGGSVPACRYSYQVRVLVPSEGTSTVRVPACTSIDDGTPERGNRETSEIFEENGRRSRKALIRATRTVSPKVITAVGTVPVRVPAVGTSLTP